MVSSANREDGEGMSARAEAKMAEISQSKSPSQALLAAVASSVFSLVSRELVELSSLPFAQRLRVLTNFLQ